MTYAKNLIFQSRMPYALEHWGKKAIVVNSKTGKHFSNSPIPLTNAKAQMRLLYLKEKEKSK